MSNESKTEINWFAVIVAIVCFINMYFAFKSPEPGLGALCLLLGLTFLYVSFPKESK